MSVNEALLATDVGSCLVHRQVLLGEKQPLAGGHSESG